MTVCILKYYPCSQLVSFTKDCVGETTRQIRRFQEDCLSRDTLCILSRRIRARRSEFTRKMSTYFALRQCTIQLKKQNADLLEQNKRVHITIKDARHMLLRDKVTLERTRRVHLQEAESMKKRILRAQQCLQRRLRYVGIGIYPWFSCMLTMFFPSAAPIEYMRSVIYSRSCATRWNRRRSGGTAAGY